MSERPPFRFHGLDHVVLQIADVERSLAFYVDALGLALERVIEDLGIYQLRCGRHLIDLQVLPAGETLAPKPGRGMEHLCLLLAGDTATMLPWLARHDVPILWGPVELYGADGFGTSIYVCDPDDHTIELKLDHAEAPLRTTGADAAATLSRPPPAPRRT